jgi:hypothetical protein
VWSKYGEKGLRLADQNLDALWQYVGDRGVSMTLVVYPWPGQIQRVERDCQQRTHWAAWSKQRKVDFIDLFPAFLDAGRALECARSRVGCVRVAAALASLM